MKSFKEFLTEEEIASMVFESDKPCSEQCSKYHPQDPTYHSCMMHCKESKAKKKKMHEMYDKFLDESEENADYKAYFAKMLKKYKVENPKELSDEDKKKFFDEVDAGWEGDNEND